MQPIRLFVCINENAIASFCEAKPKLIASDLTIKIVPYIWKDSSQLDFGELSRTAAGSFNSFNLAHLVYDFHVSAGGVPPVRRD